VALPIQVQIQVRPLDLQASLAQADQLEVRHTLGYFNNLCLFLLSPRRNSPRLSTAFLYNFTKAQ
jgi:hypothetical protein